MVPGYLVKEVYGYSDSYFKKWIKQHSWMCKTINGETWFSLRKMEEWLGSPGSNPDDDDDEE